MFSLNIVTLRNFPGLWGGGDRGSEFPAFRTLYSRFPPPSLVVPASVCFFYCKILRNVVHFLFLLTPAPLGISSPTLSSPSSRTLPAPITPRFPPPWVSRLPPSLLPPPVHFPPPLLPGSRPPCPPPLAFEWKRGWR